MRPKQMLLLASGPIGAALLGVITLPLLSWWYTPEALGQLSMLQTILSFAVVLLSLGLDQALMREYHEHPQTKELLWVTLLPGLIILSLIALMSLSLFPTAISQALFALPSTALSVGVLLLILSSYLLRYLNVMQRLREQSALFALSQVSPKAFLLLGFGIALLLNSAHDFYSLFAIQAAALLLSFALFAALSHAVWRGLWAQKLDTALLKKTLVYSLPLMFGGLAFWALSSLDRVMLRSHASLSELGIYAVAGSFAAATALLSNIFNTLWAPTVFKWVAAGEHQAQLGKITAQVLAVVMLLACLMALAVPVVPFFLPAAYHNIAVLILLCSLPALFYVLTELMGVGIAISRKTLLALACAVAAFGLALLLYWFWIPKYGAMGAAYAKLLAFALFLVLRTELARRVAMPLPRFSVYVVMLLLLVMSALSPWLWAQAWWCYMLAWLMVLGLSVGYFWRELRSLGQHFRR